MVAVHLDANYIFVESMKNRMEGEMIRVYQKIVGVLTAWLQDIQPCECKGNEHQWLGNQIFRWLGLTKEKRRSEISGRDLQKSFGEFKTVNSLQNDKY
jgi:hypothetical protein